MLDWFRTDRQPNANDHRLSLEVPKNNAEKLVICHCEADTDFVRRLNEAIRTRGALRGVTFCELLPDSHFDQDFFKSALAVIYVVTRASITSQGCRDHLKRAMQAKVRIISLVREDVDGDDSIAKLRAGTTLFGRTEEELNNSVDSVLHGFRK